MLFCLFFFLREEKKVIAKMERSRRESPEEAIPIDVRLMGCTGGTFESCLLVEFSTNWDHDHLTRRDSS